MRSFLSALCNELRALGVTTVATVETGHAGLRPGQPLAGVDQSGLSAVAENIIALHLAAIRSETYRLMSVLKARDRRTDLRMRRFEIAEGGIMLERDHQGAEAVLREISGYAAPPPPDTDLTGE